MHYLATQSRLRKSSPRVAIVTPVLNGAGFIRETIDSVLAQTHPALTYLVVDGGSTDDTLNILRSYGNRIRWVSRPDTGQADAIARGIAELDSEYVTYLNADDTLIPDAIATLVAALDNDPWAGIAYADAFRVDQSGATIAPYPTRPFDQAALLRTCFICQPATLLRRTSYNEVGGIDPTLQYVMDYDLWLRLVGRTRFLYVPLPLAQSRMRYESKRVAHRCEVYEETFRLLRDRTGYVPYEWIAGYSDALLHRFDRSFAPSPPPHLTAALALVIGLGVNYMRVGSYLQDWLAHRSLMHRIGHNDGRKFKPAAR